MIMDQAKMEKGIRVFLEGLDRGFEGDDQAATPSRVARAWAQELLSGYAVDPDGVLTWTEAPAGCGPVLVRRIHFSSICVHHLLPFFGVAHVAYLPGEYQIGISKIARIVDYYARRLQVQERLTRQIAEILFDRLKAGGVGVVIEAQHLCMMMRGVEKQNSIMKTSCLLGYFRDRASTRAEFLQLIS